MTTLPSAPWLAGRPTRGSADRIFRWATRLAALGVVAVLVLLAIQLLDSSLLTWQTFGLGFITGTTWDPVAAIYGALPYIVGTLLSSLIALVLATPIAILTAIFLAEIASPRLATPLTFMIELLAAIPSVVFGLWGVFVLAPFLRVTAEAWISSTFGFIPFLAGPTFGIGLFTAGVILAIMVLPTIVSISREVIRSVPESQREAMLALGATRWEVITKAVLPFARFTGADAVLGPEMRSTGEVMGIASDFPTAFGKAQAAADWMHAQQSRHMLTGDSVDIDTIAVPLAQPDQALHRSDLLREDNRANTHGGASHQGARLHSHLAARR